MLIDIARPGTLTSSHCTTDFEAFLDDYPARGSMIRSGTRPVLPLLPYSLLKIRPWRDSSCSEEGSTLSFLCSEIPDGYGYGVDLVM